MRRMTAIPRHDWKYQIGEQGLIYNDTTDEQGRPGSYWHEEACYEFDLPEVLQLEQVAENLHRMCREAAAFLAEEAVRPGSPWQLGISPESVEFAADSLRRNDPHLYGRFDLVHQGPEAGPAKLLEYNADTPTGLLEAAILQWHWYEQTYQEFGFDQWNSLHEALVDRWAWLKDQLGMDTLHLAHTADDTTGEDILTVSYLRETAIQAGWTTIGLEMRQIGLDADTGRFTGAQDEYLQAIFKLYPWEDMMTQGFGDAIRRGRPRGWLEPAWKMFWSNKALCAALWHLYPGHENLLPTFLDGPHDMTEWVRKPLHSREGANVEIHAAGVDTTTRGPWGDEGYVWQQYQPLPNFPGPDGQPNHPVLGVWMVGDECCGVGIRETTGLVTTASCRFLPNRIAPYTVPDGQQGAPDQH